MKYTTKKPKENKKKVQKELIENYPADKFNWWAFLFTPLYYAYHSMWKWALITFFVNLFLGMTIVVPIAVGIWAGINHNKQFLEKNGIYVKN